MPSWGRVAVVGAAAAALALVLIARRRRRAATPDADRPQPQPQPLVAIVSELAADSSQAVATLLADTFSEFACERIDLKPLSAATLPGFAAQRGFSRAAFIFIVEVDAEGDAGTARPLTRALKPLKLSTPDPLAGVHVAVIALAHSVCAFSAASGGADKYRGGQRLQNALVEAGAHLLRPLGCAEMVRREHRDARRPPPRSHSAPPCSTLAGAAGD